MAGGLRTEVLTTRAKSPRGYIDQLFKGVTWLFAAGIVALFAAMLVVLWIESKPAIDAFGFGFLTSTDWNPVLNKFGAVIAIVGTLVSTLIAMVIAIPISIGIAIYLSGMLRKISAEVLEKLLLNIFLIAQNARKSQALMAARFNVRNILKFLIQKKSFHIFTSHTF